MQFDERLSIILDFPVVLGNDILETGLVGQRLVHVALRAAAALLPYGAQTGRGETVRVTGQLEPRLLLLLLDTGSGRPQRAARLGGNGVLRGLRSDVGDVCRCPGSCSGATAVVAQQYVTGGRAQFQSVLRA